ncbi:papain fold toxin domain-containing protein [Rhodophyticola porphyridii]|uniref:papain fold toxin domain-containing protein n=1 Tax=Rhodophyticola porphyridii TaxID=1852017 RepID=UPI00131430C4
MRNRIAPFLESEQLGIVSKTGVHEAVQVGDTIFDNNFPGGLPAGSWRIDIGEGYPGIDIEIR